MRLPLFPLHTVLFPHERLPLHVFEPRYRAMVSDLLAADRRFGVVAISAGTEVGPPSEVHDVGTVAVIEQLAETEDGRFALVCRGERRFRIAKRLPDDPYPRAEAELLDDDALGDGVEDAHREARAACARHLDAIRRLGADLSLPPAADAITDSFVLPAVAPLDPPLRQQILECATAAERLRTYASIAQREAKLLGAIGPSAGVPLARPSQN